MMKRNSKNHQGNCRDRLSELPDEILVHILTFLPIKDAVRTFLLRRFGTLLSTLDFRECRRKYIRSVMRYHKNSTIDVFHLENDLESEFFDDTLPMDQHLKKCTHFALRKRAKALIVTLDREGYVYFVPPRVFSNQCLVSLELTGLYVKLPRRVFMGSLRKLELSGVFISNETFSRLTSACPSLKELIVRNPNKLEELHFTAPSIENLHLYLSVD